MVVVTVRKRSVHYKKSWKDCQPPAQGNALGDNQRVRITPCKGKSKNDFFQVDGIMNTPNGYLIYQNSKGDVMVTVGYQDSAPTTPRLFYDGGDAVLLYRNPSSCICLRNIENIFWGCFFKWNDENTKINLNFASQIFHDEVKRRSFAIWQSASSNTL